MHSIRRRLAAGAAALALATALAACGDESSDEGDDAGSSSSTTPSDGASSESSESSEADAFPVTIEHKYGSTEITEAPEKVVVIGYTDQDAVLALGVTPVAVTYWYGDESLGGINPWAEDALGGADKPELLKDADGVEIEKIAQLQPDLIIGQYAGTKESDYDLLSKIAPTVVQPKGYADYGVPWDEATLTIGKALGKSAEAQALVDDVNGQIEAAGAEHPEFEGKTAVITTPYEGLFVYGPEDPRDRILQQLGFTFPETLLGDGEAFGESLSAERAADLDDVDVTVWLGLSQDPDVRSVFESTDAFKQGRYVDIDDKVTENYAVAHSFVTPLSIPYVLERYVPQLAAAVDGDPSTKVPAPAE